MLTRLFLGFCLVLYSQDLGLSIWSRVLAEDKYHVNKDIRFTWDEANDYCRDKNSALAFTLTLDELQKLRIYIRDYHLPKDNSSGYWIGGRGEGKIWRWDFGARGVNINGWHRGEPIYKIRDGVANTCMELQYRGGSIFAESLSWNDWWCDNKRGVICQKYD